MTQQLTLSIIKPDATNRNIIGSVVEKLEKAGLKIVAMKMIRLTKEVAGEFYGEFKEKGFYNDLVTFMTSGPVVVQVLAGEDAIARNRQIMGATNPENAASGTIRKELALSIEANTVHGSDSQTSAAREIKFFFSDQEIFHQ